jgi:hypothetical protein
MEAKAAMEANNDMMHSRGEQKKTKKDFKPSDSMWLEATNCGSWITKDMAHSK